MFISTVHAICSVKQQSRASWLTARGAKSISVNKVLQFLHLRTCTSTCLQHVQWLTLEGQPLYGAGNRTFIFCNQMRSNLGTRKINYWCEYNPELPFAFGNQIVSNIRNMRYWCKLDACPQIRREATAHVTMLLATRKNFTETVSSCPWIRRAAHVDYRL